MITCAINNIEIVKALYSDINGALIAAEKSKSEFDHVSYMKDLFKDLLKTIKNLKFLFSHIL